VAFERAFLGSQVERRDKRVLSDSVTSLPFSSLLIVYTSRQERLFDEVKIVLVGKYTDLKDSYMSVIKALEHSAFRVRRKLTIQVGLGFSGIKDFTDVP
jgi:CTP synthase (UTP-ammonia lyase)